MLNVASEDGLGVFFGIFGYLLELVNDNDHGFVGLLDEAENLAESVLRVLYAAELDAESW